jgi:hypothetical protein
MIRYLKHLETDRARWDDCISRALNRKVYAFSWYLDVVSPGWEALAEEDYSSVFPLTWGRKAGISYLFQPFFTQQLGLFSVHLMNTELQKKFIENIPKKFHHIDIQLNSGGFLIGDEHGTERRINHELNLKRPYDDIVSGYSQNTRRNIRKAWEMGVNIGREVRIDELVELFRKNFGDPEGKLKPFHYERLERLMKECFGKGKGEIRGAFNEQGILSAAAFFITDAGRIYYLFAASDHIARENGAMFLLIDQFIREHAGSPFIFDFEGGNDPNLGRFYKSFGATEVFYNRIVINRLPFMLKAGLRLTRAMQKRLK